MDYSTAIVLAYLPGIVTAFVRSRAIVFERSNFGAVHEFLRFSLVNLAALAQVWLVSIALAEWFFPWVGG